ncbi:MAG: hypothetical protein HKN88_10435 [Gammaproteobacteria bacterium]|nr:hypothetical protein [Gammaproteobacteria bacterium]NNC98473.1 hypothetical protein [Gammaproteobacteria bacterium]NNM14780.1 hypothetical protein [Gammaproteobacteria bacterium]
MFNFFKKKPIAPIPLEQQLETLASLGVTFEPGITIEDLLYSFPREEYEKDPYDMVLSMLGSEVESEPWGRAFSSNVWNCDFERIYDHGDYVEIVEKLSTLAGMSDSVSELEDHIDFDKDNAWLKFKINGNEKHYKIKINNDWIDPDVMTALLADFENGENQFYEINLGQASLYFYFNPEQFEALKKLSKRKMSRSRSSIDDA